jgi:hypothetical protein
VGQEWLLMQRPLIDVFCLAEKETLFQKKNLTIAEQTILLSTTNCMAVFSSSQLIHEYQL